MLPLGPSPETTAARKERGAAFLSAARKRVLQRHGVSEDDIGGMTDEEKDRSHLGSEIIFEIMHSEFAIVYKEADNKLRSSEDKRDVEARVHEVMKINAETPYPLPTETINLLNRKYHKRIRDYSYNCYYADVFGSPANKAWQPDVDRQAIITKMTEEAPHKEAFRIVGEIAKLERVARLKRITNIISDIPKYVSYIALGIFVLFLLSLAGDVLSYLHRAPTVRLIEKSIEGLWAWIFTAVGLITCAAFVAVSLALGRVVQYLRRLAAKDK